MSLKLDSEGKVMVTTPEECVKAVELAYELKEGIKEELDEIDELRKAAANYMKENDIKQLDLPNVDGHATLIQRHDSYWDGEELLDLVKEHEPKNWKRIWQRLTVRVPDREKIQQAIRNGLIDADSISGAFKQKAQKPYVQVYND